MLTLSCPAAPAGTASFGMLTVELDVVQVADEVAGTGDRAEAGEGNQAPADRPGVSS